MQALAAEPKTLPRLLVGTVAEVAGAWTTCDQAVITATRDFHVWTPDYLVKRWAVSVELWLTTGYVGTCHGQGCVLLLKRYSRQTEGTHITA